MLLVMRPELRDVTTLVRSRFRRTVEAKETT
jgi:hypothetical protein